LSQVRHGSHERKRHHHVKLHDRRFAAHKVNNHIFRRHRDYHRAHRHAFEHHCKYRRAPKHALRRHHKHYRKHRSSQKIYSYWVSAFEPGWCITIKTKNRW
jgi:hypothetical protein